MQVPMREEPMRRAPWTEMHDADLALVRRLGVPDEAIDEHGTIDLVLLRRLGWTVTATELRPPAMGDVR